MRTAPMVYKSNALVEAAYRLSVYEQRIILTAITKVPRGQPVTDEVMYSVSIADIVGATGVTVNSTYGQLKEAALRLKRREVQLTEQPNGKGRTPKVLAVNWVQTVAYRDGEGTVEIRFNRDMLPYLTELSEQFTKYALADVMKLDTAYAIRLYELLMQWSSIGKREIAVEDFRRLLQLEDRYPVVKDLRRWVLEPAVDQINEHTPLKVNWEQRKTGRRISHLMFTFGPKEPAKLPRPRKYSPWSDPEIIKREARPGETTEQVRARLREEYEQKARQK